MESFEYFRATSSPVPELQSPTWARSSTPRSSIAARGTDVELPGLCAAWDSGSLLDDSATSSELDHSGSPPGSYVFAAEEQFMGEATVAIRHSGWLLKASGKGPHRKWHKQWVYLKDDRLCYTPDPGGSEGVRYIALDRIPLRPLPRGYGPKIGITIVDSRQLDTSSAAVRGKRAGCIFSVACGSHTHFWAADTPASAKDWVEQITRAWSRCVKHVARGTHSPGADELLAMREAKWRAENEALRKSLAEADKLRHAAQSSEQWRVLLEAEKKQESIQELVKYNVQVVTGSCKGAGTSSQVYIEVYDKAGRSSGEHQLVVRGDGKQPFKRGAIDNFQIECCEMGNHLSKVRVYHDNTGTSPSWYLEELRVRRAASNGEWTVFPCQRWLAVDVEDGRVMRDLQPGCRADLVTYRVTATTTDLRGADTTANVYITLHGSRGDSQRHALATGPHNFERGSTDAFAIQDRDLGMLEAVTIGHDGTGLKPAWHLQQVSVINSTSGQEWLFPCRQWFDADSGDRNIERRLQEGRGPPEPCWYTVVVCTSDVRGAGTTSEVCLSLHGSDGTSPHVKLPSQAGDFERGHEDVFRVQLPRVGRLQSLTVGQNCTGASPDWHLEQVEVTDEQSGETSYFGCNNWLSSRQGDGLAERTLVASSTNPRDQLATYRLELHTSDLRAAGTSACVWVQLHGAAGSSDVQKVQGTPKSYQRGAVDTHAFTCGALGDLRKLTVGHDGMGDSPSWHLQKAVVTCLKTGFVTEFPCNRWLATDEDDGCTTRDLYPNSSSAKLAQYILTVHTSDQRGAGTTARVYVALVGKQHTVGPLHLDNDKLNFQRGRVDVFKLTEMDVGELQHLRIWHDNSGPASSWALDFIELTKGSEAPVYFTCHDWLAEPAYQKVLMPTLADPRTAMITYELAVRTADMKGAGTDSNLRFILHGASRSSHVIPLPTGPGAFERGKVDHFRFRLPTVGNLQRLELLSDGSGQNPGWFCDSVSVTESSTGTATYFLCNRWLDSKHGLQVHLEGSSRNPELDYTSYQLDLDTSDIPQSSTDGDVYIELKGSTGSSGWQKVVPAAKVSSLDRGQKASAELRLRGLGSLQQASLRLENATCGWHLEAVTISDGATGDRWYLPCHAWFTQKHGMEHTLTAFKASDVAEYRMRLHTSDTPVAGTSARVSVELVGRAGKTSKIWLGPGATLPGQTAEHLVSWGALGDLQQLVIGHDGSSTSPSWHLDYAEVVQPPAGQVIFFDCNQWLSREHGDGCLERTLHASTADPSLSRCSYKITVHTSNLRTAGLPGSMPISLVITGAKGALPRCQLESAGAFARGQTDTFQVVGPDIGAFTRLSIQVEDASSKAQWHLASVEVQNEKTGQRGLFVGRQWVTSSSSTILSPSESAELDDVEYEVTVHTSDVRGAATDAEVLLELHGSQGASGALRLPSTPSSFKRAAADSFNLLAADCGELQELHIWHTGKRSGGWHCEYVELTNKSSGSTWFFVCRDWVADGQHKVLPASSKDPRLDEVTYKVVVYTSDVKGAGTDASVFLELKGDQHCSGPVVLSSSDSSAFERGQVDTFTLRLPRLGEVVEALVGHDGKGKRPSWHLDCIEVREVEAGHVWYFKCGEWLRSEGTGAVQKVLKAQPDNPRDSLVKYVVKTFTSDLRGAGTDACVLIQLFGTSGQTDRLQLSGDQVAFERGQQNEFTVKADGLGQLRKIWIGHDNEGGNAAWHLEKCLVLDTSSGQEYFFKCGAWIDGDGSPVGVELHCGPEDTFAAQVSLVDYELTIKTGDVRNAGTDADVSVSIVGSSGSSGVQKLQAGAGAFRRGSVDSFRLRLPALGTLQQLELSRTAEGQQQGWFVDWVKIIERSSGQETYFFAKAWLDDSHGLAAVLKPGQGQRFKVFVHTSNISDAGTDCGLLITFHGDKGSSGQLPLSSKTAALDPGTANEFQIETQEVGTLQRITIKIDEQGSCKSWHCASIEVGSTLDGSLVAFPCDSWFGKGKGDGLVERDLYPEGSPQAMVQVPYKISIHTSGDEPAAGMRRGVGLELHGSANVAGPIMLDNDGAYFGQGSVDTFKVQAADVGSLQQLRIWVDSPGDATSRWFLDMVEVTNEDLGQTAYFVCRRWLDRRNGYEVTLPASSSNPRLQDTDYKVCIYTSSFSGAETSGNVIINIIGQKRESGVLTLRNKAGMSFRSGKRDDFNMRLPPLGSLTAISIGHDGPRDYHLDKVDIVDTSSGTTYFFPAECWVQSSGRAGILGQTLKLKAFTTDPATLPVPYQVIVTVDDVKGVMRKAAVALTFLGTRGNTGSQMVDLSKFIRTGKPKVVSYFDAPNIGQMESVRVGLDGQEEDCSCLLSSIELINQSSGDKAVFACGEWLHSGDDFDLEFWAGEAPKEVACSYRCELQTSDLRKAGTTGHVYLTIIGERERIGTYKLSNPSGDHFQRGQLDVFQISNAPDIGQLRQIEVRHDGQKKTAWHLAFVKVANQQTGAVAMFNCNRWIDKQTGDPEVVGVVVAMPSKPDLQQPLANRFALKDKTVHMAAAGRGTVTFQEGTKKAPSDLPLQEQSGYKVAFHTSRGCGSGTNSKVHFELLGSRDSSGVIMPVAAKRSFKPGRVDVFTFLDMPYLGDLQAIKVGTDGTGLFPGWHLRQVDVTHLPTEQRWVFACYNWLDKSCNYYRWLQLDGGEIKTAKGVEQLQPVRSPGARQESQQQQQQQQKQRAGGSPSASQRLVPGMSGRATSSPMRRSPGRLAPQLFEADFDGMRSPMIGARW